MHVRLVSVAIAALLLSATVSAAPLQVAVSIAPQRCFVEQVGGARVAVTLLVEPGADMHTYEPRPQQMVELARAAVYFAIGADVERVWLKKLSEANPNLPVVQLDAGIDKIRMPEHGHAAETGKSRAPHAGVPDPHIWLSPPLVRRMAVTIRDALIARDPQGEALYRQNHARFDGEITQLDSAIRALLQSRPQAQRRFMVYHPSWGYFARAYGLKQIPVETGGKAPGPRDLIRLIDQARCDGIRVVFVQPQLSDKNARVIAAEIGGRVVKADPLAYDWADNLLGVAREIVLSNE